MQQPGHCAGVFAKPQPTVLIHSATDLSRLVVTTRLLLSGQAGERGARGGGHRGEVSN